MARASPARLVGLGNDARHDDGAGLEVARRLAARGPPGIAVTVGVPDVGALVELLAGPGPVFLADAVRGIGPPGSVTRWSRSGGSPPPGEPVVSTHGLSLPEALGLAGALGRPLPHVVLYGIEAGDLSMGVGLSEPVLRGVGEVVDRLEAELLGPREASRKVPDHA